MFQGLEFWADSPLPAKRGRGRPRVDSEPMSLRIPRYLLDAIDRWRDEQLIPPKRVDILRVALVEWLKGKGVLK